MAAYKIGNFTFDTEEEYARGLEDAKKIEKIQNTVDLSEPETALRLYWLIRTGKIKFGSKVGKKFFLDIADAVAKSAAKNISPPVFLENCGNASNKRRNSKAKRKN